MKKILLSITAGITAFGAFAQQEQQFSQYMYDRLSINPGYAGIEGTYCLTSLYRSQWAGFDGAPKTFLLNAHGPVKLLRGGVGLTFFSDKIGFFANNTVRLSYSYHQAVGSKGDVLGIGVSAGFMSVSVNPTWIAIQPISSDNSITANGQSTSSSGMDFGLGLYYKSRTFYVGASATHLSETDLSQLNVKTARHYYLLAGYDYNSGQFTFRPSVRVESDATSTQVDANFNVLYDFNGNQKAWLGVGYRIKDAVIPMLGFQQNVGSQNLPGTIRVGYAYDVTTSEIKNYSNGSHEILVSWCFNVSIPPKVQKSKTVRFL